MGEGAFESMVTDRSTGLRIVLVGAGNVATHLARALCTHSLKPVQLFSRTLASAQRLGAECSIPYTNRWEEVDKTADVYLVSVTDGAIPEVAAALVREQVQGVFIHTAGSVPMETWRQQGAAHYGILYPLQTFTKEKTVDFRQIPLFIEASDAHTLGIVRQLAEILSPMVYIADSERRAKLHLAAVFASNFTNVLYGLSAELLEKADLPFQVMLPLIDETARKVHELSPRQAQTGPASRNDGTVMKRQWEALAAYPDWQELYKRMSQLILDFKTES